MSRAQRKHRPKRTAKLLRSLSGSLAPWAIGPHRDALDELTECVRATELKNSKVGDGRASALDDSSDEFETNHVGIR